MFNGLVVLVVVYVVGVVLVEVILVLVCFCSVKCCMEVIGSYDGIIVYDDFVYYLIVIVIMLEGLCFKVGDVCIVVVMELCSNLMWLGVYV